MNSEHIKFREELRSRGHDMAEEGDTTVFLDKMGRQCLVSEMGEDLLMFGVVNITSDEAMEMALGREVDLDADIETLGLDVRVSNLLRREGVYDVGQLASKRHSDVSSMRGVGIGTMRDIERALELVGLSLRK